MFYFAELANGLIKIKTKLPITAGIMKLMNQIKAITNRIRG
jgi:hypothetical protein